MQADCLACELTSGSRDLPGGRIHATPHWVVEHCVGPLPVGTLLVKPFRHCLGLAELTPQEAAELGPLLAHASACVRELATADQVYACLWSHAEWTPGHIHFVVQPSWNRLRDEFPRPGPFLQVDLFSAPKLPPQAEVEVFCDAARRWTGWATR